MTFTVLAKYGLAFPVIKFVRQILWLYNLQLHHLTPQCILHMACFAAFCEGYLGIWTHLGLWFSLFCARGRIMGEGGS